MTTPITTAAEGLGTDDDLIRRGDILPAIMAAGFGGSALVTAIRALTARIAAPEVGVKPQDGPERIWADTEGRWTGFDASEIRRDPCVEYIRADLAQPAAPEVGVTVIPVHGGFYGERPDEAGYFGDLTARPASEIAAEAVAGAFLAAGKAALPPGDGWRGALCEAAVIAAQRRVLAATPADAIEALARRDAETREKALREAAAKAEAAEAKLRAMSAAARAEFEAREAYKAVPTDRGGASGPKGRAFFKWIDARAILKAAVLNAEVSA